MRISVNEDYFKCRPIERRNQLQSLKLVRDGGFDTVDFGMFYMKKARDEGDDHDSWIKGRREYCDSLDLR